MLDMKNTLLCAVAGIGMATAAAGNPDFVPELPVYAEDAIGPKLRAEIVRETPGRLASLKARMDAQWGRVKAEIGEDMACFQYVRTLKRMEIARRLFGLAEKELARGSTDGLAFAFLYTEDLRRFCDLFDEELRLWKDYPLAPGVKPAVFRVADYGAKGDGKADSIPAFDAAIDEARKLQGRPAIIEVPDGEFHFRPATNRTHVLLEGLTNVVMRGTGPAKTRLRFHNMDCCGTEIRGCLNVTIVGVDLAFAENPFFQGTVEQFDKPGGWAIVKMCPGTVRPDDERFLKGGQMGFCLGIFDAAGNEVVDGWQEMFYDRRADDLGDGRFKVYLQKDHFIYKRPNSRLEPGWQIVFPLRKGFCQNAGTTGGSRMCNYADTWIRNGRGSAVGFCNGGVYSSAWRVKVIPLPGLLAASGADGIMNYRGTFIGECVFDHLNDDGANAHALGRRIIRLEGDDTVIADWLPGNYAPGETMQILSGLTGQYLFLGRVKRAGKDLRGGWIHNTMFEEPLPQGIRTIESFKAPSATAAERQAQLIGGAKVDASKEPDQMYRPYMFGVGHVVYKCRFSSLRGSGAVLACPNALIEDTSYEYMNRGISLSTLGGFVEGPSPYNVWVKGCTFRHCPIGIEGRCVTAIGRKFLTAPVRGLTLEHNTYEDVARPVILDNVGDDVELR